MYITIDERDGRPIYKQVVDEIRALIARGELREGSALPPVRQVASDLGVNLNTIAFAYRSLQKDGLIKVKHGSGAVVTSRLLSNKTEELLRVHLRTALTNMALAGFSRAEINSFVNEDLKELSGPG